MLIMIYDILNILKNISFVLFCFAILAILGYIVISKTLTDDTKIEEHKKDDF